MASPDPSHCKRMRRYRGVQCGKWLVYRIEELYKPQASILSSCEDYRDQRWREMVWGAGDGLYIP